MGLEPLGSTLPTALAWTFPVGDWQFWVVTALFALALVWLGRGLLPWGKRGRGKRTRVTLTVGGKAPGAEGSGREPS